MLEVALGDRMHYQTIGECNFFAYWSARLMLSALIWLLPSLLADHLFSTANRLDGGSAANAFISGMISEHLLRAHNLSFVLRNANMRYASFLRFSLNSGMQPSYIIVVRRRLRGGAVRGDQRPECRY